MQKWLEKNRNKEAIKKLQDERITILTAVVNGIISKTDGQLMLKSITEEIYALFAKGREVILDSPIEEMMHQALIDAIGNFLWVAESVSILPQFEVFDGQYRLDFAVFVKSNDRLLKIAVECDGYLYHEADREQIVRDKQRERRLVIDGWAVMRFSSKEIHENVNKCVSDILRYVEAQLLQRRSAV